jgi:hypothetical protein
VHTDHTLSPARHHSVTGKRATTRDRGVVTAPRHASTWAASLNWAEPTGQSRWPKACPLLCGWFFFFSFDLNFPEIVAKF